ncbi:armadillo-type protein [Polychytrium aggregatum]|uniref:armadillo-type protein n=1 Tax=Polychytrium aggregatum TaxID=110093 RepID=UPI0022FDB85E|nr:armadillo-type protein [Polychytrium aggregatum]KAI9197247.1 armadillo-type protein [Polychytrium aggregatum]
MAVSCLVKYGIENEDWRVRKEAIDAALVVMDQDSGSWDFDQLVGGLVGRLRDVSDAVVNSAGKALAHLVELFGDASIQESVQMLGPTQKQLYKVFRSNPQGMGGKLVASASPHSAAEPSGRTKQPALPRRVGVSLEAHALDEASGYRAQADQSIKILGKGQHGGSGGALNLEFGFVPLSIIARLQVDGDWKTRAAAIEELQDLCFRDDNQTTLRPHLRSFLSFLSVLMGDHNFKISLTALHILGRMAKDMGEDMRPHLSAVIASLIEKFADNKMVMRQTAMKITTLLMTIHSPKSVLACLLRSLGHPHPRVREEIVNCITTALLNFEVRNFDVPSLVVDLLTALRDPKAKVKYVTVEAYSVISSFITPERLLRMLREYGVDDETLQLLLLRFSDPTIPQLNADGLVEHIISRSNTTTPRPLSQLSLANDAAPFPTIQRSPAKPSTDVRQQIVLTSPTTQCSISSRRSSVPTERDDASTAYHPSRSSSTAADMRRVAPPAVFAKPPRETPSRAGRGLSRQALFSPDASTAIASEIGDDDKPSPPRRYSSMSSTPPGHSDEVSDASPSARTTTTVSYGSGYSQTTSTGSSDYIELKSDSSLPSSAQGSDRRQTLSPGCVLAPGAGSRRFSESNPAPRPGFDPAMGSRVVTATARAGFERPKLPRIRSVSAAVSDELDPIAENSHDHMQLDAARSTSSMSEPILVAPSSTIIEIDRPWKNQGPQTHRAAPHRREASSDSANLLHGQTPAMPRLGSQKDHPHSKSSEPHWRSPSDETDPSASHRDPAYMPFVRSSPKPRAAASCAPSKESKSPLPSTRRNVDKATHLITTDATHSIAYHTLTDTHESCSISVAAEPSTLSRSVLTHNDDDLPTYGSHKLSGVLESLDDSKRERNAPSGRQHILDNAGEGYVPTLASRKALPTTKTRDPSRSHERRATVSEGQLALSQDERSSDLAPSSETVMVPGSRQATAERPAIYTMQERDTDRSAQAFSHARDAQDSANIPTAFLRKETNTAINADKPGDQELPAKPVRSVKRAATTKIDQPEKSSHVDHQIQGHQPAAASNSMRTQKSQQPGQNERGESHEATESHNKPSNKAADYALQKHVAALESPPSVTREKPKTKSGLQPGRKPDHTKPATMPADQQFRDALAILKSEQEWDVKSRALESLRGILDDRPDMFQTQLHELVLSVVGQVQNLRSSVSKVAIGLLGDMFVKLGKAMEADLDITTATLLKKLGEGGFIIEEADKALSLMSGAVGPARLVTAVLPNADHKNTVVRTKVATLLSRAIVGMGEGQAVKYLQPMEADRLFTVLVQFLRDGSSETRQAARQIVQSLSKLPEFDKAVEKSLPPSSVREIRDAQRQASKSARDSTQQLVKSDSNIGPSEQGRASRSLSRQKSTKSRIKLKEVADDEMERLQGLYAEMTSSDWKQRHDGLVKTAELIQSSGEIIESTHMVKVVDHINERIKDGNSKVALCALQCFDALLPMLKDRADIYVANIVPTVTNLVGSSNLPLRTAAGQTLDRLVDHTDNALLLQSLTSIAQYGTNAKVKAAVVEKMIVLCQNLYSSKPQLVTKVVLPVSLKLLPDNRSEIKSANARLVRALYSMIGPEFFQYTQNVGPDGQTRIMAILE